MPTYYPRATLDSALDEMTRAYLECAEWCGLYDDDRSAFDRSLYPHWSPEAQREAEADCQDFLSQNLADIGDNLSQAGHDFWLTRNRHGAGFWDGNWPTDAGLRLTANAHPFGEVNVTFNPQTERLSFI